MSTVAVQERMRQEIAEKRIFDQARAYAFDYMDGIRRRGVFPDRRALAALAAFEEPLPESPQPAEEVLRQLHEHGSPATVAQTGGRYFGFVNGGIVPTALAARWLSDAWDQNAALYVMSPTAAKLEQVCERWLAELFGLPDDTAAGLVGGTSVATLCGLAAARHAIMERLGWDVPSKGLRGAPSWRVVTSAQAHGTVFKVLTLLGVGAQDVERVEADSQGRIDVARLPRLDSRTLLIVQAGNVNTGAFDAFEEIAGLANRAEAWLHVDGAFGMWAAASRRKRPLTRGLDKADSWSVDGHKTLNTPYDCGVILCRHREALLTAMQASGAYLHYSEERDGMLYGPDMSRRARAVELWATLKYLGRVGVEQLVDGLCERAVEFAERLRERGFVILNDVVFNQVLVACDTELAMKEMLARIQRSGVCWYGGTSWQGAPAIRISVCSWATTSDDVEKSVAALVEARDATLTS